MWLTVKSQGLEFSSTLSAVHGSVTRGRCCPSNPSIFFPTQAPNQHDMQGSSHIITFMFYHQVYRHSSTDSVKLLTVTSYFTKRHRVCEAALFKCKTFLISTSSFTCIHNINTKIKSAPCDNVADFDYSNNIADQDSQLLQDLRLQLWSWIT